MRNENNGLRPYTLVIRFTAIVAMATSVVVIYGWLTETWAIVALLPEEPAMKFNVAVCFLQLGAGLYLQTVKWPEDILKMVLGLLCLPMFTLALFTALQTLFNVDLYADDFFVSDNYTPTIFPGAIPGRMSVLTAFCFVFASVGITFRPFKNNRGDEVFQAMLHMVSLTTILVFIGHLFGLDELQHVSPYTYMPLSTATLLFLMVAGATLLRPHAGLMRLFKKKK